jgi:hypothetical protein
MNAILDLTYRNRKAMLKIIESLSTAQLNYIPEAFNNNIIWNLAHVISVQQGLVYGLSNLNFKVEKDFVKAYTKGTMPQGDVSEKDIAYIKEQLLYTIEETEIDLNENRFNTYKDYPVMLGNTLTNVTEAMQFNNYHEGLHLGAIMALKKFV